MSVPDGTGLGHEHTLRLGETTISYVSALTNVNTLDLSRCRDISDVCASSRVNTLDLSRCDCIRDVTADFRYRIAHTTATTLSPSRRILVYTHINPTLSVLAWRPSGQFCL